MGNTLLRKLAGEKNPRTRRSEFLTASEEGSIYRIAKLFLNDDVTPERRYTAIETFNYR